jgi:hypothetical protein
VLDIIFSAPAFNMSKEDLSDESPSFVLNHCDLDFQNILVDDDGNATGIVDWELCTAVPRAVGYTSLPLFLRKDWLPKYTVQKSPHMLWSFERYREHYTDAIMEAGCPDARYTRNSGIYPRVQCCS